MGMAIPIGREFFGRIQAHIIASHRVILKVAFKISNYLL